MMSLLKNTFYFFTRQVPTIWNCWRSGIGYDPTWRISGCPKSFRRKWFEKKLFGKKGGSLIIGKHFICLNKVDSNSIGLIQPCLFNYGMDGSIIKIGDHVGISGSTINATTSITIGNNTNIGSGCIITDTDSHPIHWKVRRENTEPAPTKPIVIGDDVFIGARSIILKGVTIGDGAVIGAGSVVSRDIPPRVVACGNPAVVIKEIR